MKCVVSNKSGGGVFVEVTTGEGDDKTTAIVKKLPGDTVNLDKAVADDLIDKGVVKPWSNKEA